MSNDQKKPTTSKTSATEIKIKELPVRKDVKGGKIYI